MDYDREEFELRGWTVKIERDPYPANPRDWDGNFLWLGFPHRNYIFGDEQVDDLEELHVPCGSCDGTGKLPTGDCALCDGDGWYHPRSIAEACEQLAAERYAIHWEYVWMTEHSTCHYSIGRHAPDRWDSGCAGIMLVTREMAEAWGCNPENDPDEWSRQMKDEIEQYDAYANGDAWRYVILDRDGEEVEGWSNDIFDRDECIAEARASVPAEEAPPASPKPKRVTVPVHMIAKVQDWLDGRERMNTLEDAGKADPDEWHASDDDGCDITAWLAGELGLTPAPYDAMTDGAARVPDADIFERHLPLMPAIAVNETSHVDPVTGITVYTNAEADRAYRLFELNEVPKHEWMVRLILHATDTRPARFADVVLNNEGLDLSGSMRAWFHETNSDDEPTGPVRHIPLSAIDAIVVY